LSSWLPRAVLEPLPKTPARAIHETAASLANVVAVEAATGPARAAPPAPSGLAAYIQVGIESAVWALHHPARFRHEEVVVQAPTEPAEPEGEESELHWTHTWRNGWIGRHYLEGKGTLDEFKWMKNKEAAYPIF